MPFLSFRVYSFSITLKSVMNKDYSNQIKKTFFKINVNSEIKTQNEQNYTLDIGHRSLR